MKVNIFALTFYSTLIYLVNSDPQQGPEINDQFEESNHTEAETKNVQHIENNSLIETIDDIVVPNTQYDLPVYAENNIEINNTSQTEINITKVEQPSLITRVYVAITRPIQEFIQTPKVNIVLRNIGTCIVNGAMELVSFYFPTPLIPLIASAAGMIIPFEPVVTLRKRMPVTSYRRAFKTAVNSFMGTFDKFKTSEEDPYMTRRFNRRFMGDPNDQDKD